MIHLFGLTRIGLALNYRLGFVVLVTLGSYQNTHNTKTPHTNTHTHTHLGSSCPNNLLLWCECVVVYTFISSSLNFHLKVALTLQLSFPRSPHFALTWCLLITLQRLRSVKSDQDKGRESGLHVSNSLHQIRK